MKSSELWKIALLSVALSIPHPAAAAMGTTHDQPDPWITFKTKIALLTTRDLNGMNIHVDAIHGLVTLSGDVNSPAERLRAVKVAKGIEGVHGVRNLLQVKPSPAVAAALKQTDEELKNRIVGALAKEPTLYRSHIQVKSVNHGVVLLGGKAESMTEQLQAIRMARSTPGVRSVSSTIEGPSRVYDSEIWYADSPASAEADTAPGTGVADAWITTKTKLRLMADKETPASEINVDTDNHVVTLFGIVPTEASKKASEANAWKVGGVREVHNELQVVAPRNKKRIEWKDDQIEKAVTRSLKSHPGMNEVDIEVRGGVVRLTGTAPTELDILTASMLAHSVAGVQAVITETTMKANS